MLGKSLCCTGLKRPSTSASAPRPLRNPLRVPSDMSSSSSSSRDHQQLFKNFNSLYEPSSDSSSDETPTPASSADSSDDPDLLAAALASRRFFLASPGRSNSIVDSSCAAAAAPVGLGVAVPTYSPDPYRDFRQSMEEMAEALGLDARCGDGRARLHELLLCYLALNRRHAHKYIVGAFTDLLRGLEEGGDGASEAAAVA